MRGFPKPLIRVLKSETALPKLGQVGHRIGNSLTSEATPKGPKRTFTLGKGSTHPAKDCTHPLETSYNGIITAFTLANDPISRHSTNCLKSRLATGSPPSIGRLCDSADMLSGRSPGWYYFSSWQQPESALIG